MNIFLSLKKHIADSSFVKRTGDLRELEDWRVFYVDLMFLLSIILVPAGFFVGLPVLISTNSYGIIVMDVLIIVVSLIFVTRRVDLLKKIMLFGLLYTLVIVHLVYFGPSYSRPGWIIFSTVTASLIFGTPAAFISVALNAAMLSTISFADFLQLDSWAETYNEPLMTRMMFIVNISLLSLASSLPVSVLLNRLNGSFRREKALSDRLIKESAELHRINLSLENEITERRRSEVERDKLQSQLLQSQKLDSIGRLAGGIAHDFNNMLSVILGNSEILREEREIPEMYRSIADDIHTAGMRSADLTRQLLGFARRQAIRPVPVDLNSTINGMIKMLKRLIGENIRLDWRPGNHVWSVSIDPSQVDQMLVNLVVNARDAITGEGIIKIETSSVEIDKLFAMNIPGALKGDYTMLAVTDNGSGIDRETMANIFEPFFTTKPEGMGTGLGLATVYGIVRQNSGFIDVNSESGSGSTFRIYLPRCGYDADVAKNSEGGAVNGGDETILLVEDESSVLILTSNLLRKLGYNVLCASGPEESIKIVAEYSGSIDLLVTDVILPGMNGRVLRDKILAIKPGIKCLFMSGYTNDVIAHNGILSDGVRLIQKPFSLETLGTGIRSILDLK